MISIIVNDLSTLLGCSPNKSISYLLDLLFTDYDGYHDFLVQFRSAVCLFKECLWDMEAFSIKLIAVVAGIRALWVEKILKTNCRAGTSIRDLRVIEIFLKL